MTKLRPTPPVDKIARFRERQEEGIGFDEQLHEAPPRFDIGMESFNDGPMSPSEIEAQLREYLVYDRDPLAAPAEPSLLAVSPISSSIPDGLSRPPKRVCGARTRKGTPCQCKKLYRGGRCALHGGLSTGPKSAEGMARVALNLPNAVRPETTSVNAMTPDAEDLIES